MGQSVFFGKLSHAHRLRPLIHIPTRAHTHTHTLIHISTNKLCTQRALGNIKGSWWWVCRYSIRVPYSKCLQMSRMLWKGHMFVLCVYVCRPQGSEGPTATESFLRCHRWIWAQRGWCEQPYPHTVAHLVSLSPNTYTWVDPLYLYQSLQMPINSLSTKDHAPLGHPESVAYGVRCLVQLIC